MCLKAFRLLSNMTNFFTSASVLCPGSCCITLRAHLGMNTCRQEVGERGEGKGDWEEGAKKRDKMCNLTLYRQCTGGVVPLTWFEAANSALL